MPSDYTLFPSIVPEDNTVDAAEILQEWEYPLLRNAAAVVNENSAYESDINGKSTKQEIAQFLASNCTAEGVEVIKEKAEERLNESDD